MKLVCAKCGKHVGEIEKGSIRKAVLLCAECWLKALTAMDVAEQARADLPDFMKGLFK